MRRRCSSYMQTPCDRLFSVESSWMLCPRKNCTTTAPMPPIATTRTMVSPIRYPASVRQSASAAVTVVLPVRQVADNGFSDGGIDMRIAREHYAIVTKQRDRLIGPARERCIGFLEVLRCDRADDQAEEFAVRSPEFTGEGNGPDAGLAILRRFAEHRVQSRAGLQRLKIVLTCEIEGWGWPGLRRIDESAIGADQHDRTDVREAADLVPQHQVDAASHHGAGIELIGDDRERFHVFDQVGLDEVDRLEVTRRLPGKHGCGCHQLLLALFDRVMTQVGQDQGYHADHQRDQECAA